jgi:hypothetical protein
MMENIQKPKVETVLRALYILKKAGGFKIKHKHVFDETVAFEKVENPTKSQVKTAIKNLNQYGGFEFVRRIESYDDIIL